MRCAITDVAHLSVFVPGPVLMRVCEGHRRCFSHASTISPVPIVSVTIASHSSIFIPIMALEEPAVLPNGGPTFTSVPEATHASF
jgi:hypothetical protein